MTRVLITGAAGYIGRLLATRLHGQVDVVGVDEVEPRQAEPLGTGATHDPFGGPVAPHDQATGVDDHEGVRQPLDEIPALGRRHFRFPAHGPMIGGTRAGLKPERTFFPYVTVSRP